MLQCVPGELPLILRAYCSVRSYARFFCRPLAAVSTLPFGFHITFPLCLSGPSPAHGFLRFATCYTMVPFRFHFISTKSFGSVLTTPSNAVAYDLFGAPRWNRTNYLPFTRGAHRQQCFWSLSFFFTGIRVSRKFC